MCGKARMWLACFTVAEVLLLVCGYSTAESNGGCVPAPPDTLINGTGTLNNGVPIVNFSDTNVQLKVGGRQTDSWIMFSVTQVQQHGLWCQIGSGGRKKHSGDGDIGVWYYPTQDKFIPVPGIDPNDSVSYQSLNCTDQIGLVMIVNKTDNQSTGIVRCSPSAANQTFYLLVYSDMVFNNYFGPYVDLNMTLSILSSRDADPNIEYFLSFNVSFGPPSRINCIYTNMCENVMVRKNYSIDGIQLSYHVIRSQYIDSSQPDMTHVTVRLPPQPRENRTYTCTVTVEGRVNISSGNYMPVTKGTGSSSVKLRVASTPTGVKVRRTDLTTVEVSWNSNSLYHSFFEVFYQVAAGGNNVSVGNTSKTEMILTELTLEVTYSIFVVAFSPKGNVLPSAHSEIVNITTNIPHLATSNLTINTNTSITVSGTAPEFFPDSYIIFYYCQRLCGAAPQIGSTSVMLSENTCYTYTIFEVYFGAACIVNVTAVFNNISSNTVTSSINTTIAAPKGVPQELTNTSTENRSISIVWGKVPCPDQRGPTTGYRLRYHNGTAIANTSGEGSRHYVLTGLTPFTNYSVQVAAVNDGGTGPYSTPLTVKTSHTTPGPVTSLSATSELLQLIISWSPPSKPNGVIVTYEVGFNNSEGVFVYTNTSATQHTLRNLPPNTVVTFSVRAYTIAGPGEDVTDQASTKMIPFVAGVKVEVLNATAVRVFWTPINLPVVDYYTVHFAVVNGIRRVCGRGRFNVTAGSSSGVVGGLMTGEQYQFSVSVTVSGGGQYYTGPVSDPTDPVTVVDALPFGIFAGLVVGGTLLMLSLVGNIIAMSVIVIFWRKVKELTTRLNSFVSIRHSVASEIYDVPIFSDINKCDEFKSTPSDVVYPNKQLQRDEFEMTSCEAYSTAINVC